MDTFHTLPAIAMLPSLPNSCVWGGAAIRAALARFDSQRDIDLFVPFSLFEEPFVHFACSSKVYQLERMEGLLPKRRYKLRLTLHATDPDDRPVFTYDVVRLPDGYSYGMALEHSISSLATIGFDLETHKWTNPDAVKGNNFTLYSGGQSERPFNWIAKHSAYLPDTGVYTLKKSTQEREQFVKKCGYNTCGSDDIVGNPWVVIPKGSRAQLLKAFDAEKALAKKRKHEAEEKLLKEESIKKQKKTQLAAATEALAVANFVLGCLHKQL